MNLILKEILLLSKLGTGENGHKLIKDNSTNKDPVQNIILNFEIQWHKTRLLATTVSFKTVS